MLLKWRDRYQVKSADPGQAHLVPSDMEAARAEIQRLQRELAEVQEERDILKKVVNIFSRRKP
jgi:transposase-like protein